MDQQTKAWRSEKTCPSLNSIKKAETTLETQLWDVKPGLSAAIPRPAITVVLRLRSTDAEDPTEGAMCDVVLIKKRSLS